MKEQPSRDTIATWAALIRVSQGFLEQVEAELKEANLPPLAWYDVLHELSGAGKRGLRPFELVEQLLLAQYQTSRLLARMEMDCAIERGVCPEDGRGQIIRITDRGDELRRQMWMIYGPTIEKNIGERLSPTQRKQLLKLLDKCKE